MPQSFLRTYLSAYVSKQTNNRSHSGSSSHSHTMILADVWEPEVVEPPTFSNKKCACCNRIKGGLNADIQIAHTRVGNLAQIALWKEWWPRIDLYAGVAWTSVANQHVWLRQGVMKQHRVKFVMCQHKYQRVLLSTSQHIYSVWQWP